MVRIPRPRALVSVQFGPEASARRTMEKRTALRPQSHRKVSSAIHDAGLIVTGTPTERSAVTQCALDDRSHRTKCWCRRYNHGSGSGRRTRAHTSGWRAVRGRVSLEAPQQNARRWSNPQPPAIPPLLTCGVHSVSLIVRVTLSGVTDGQRDEQVSRIASR